jgi:hypothetical protein
LAQENWQKSCSQNVGEIECRTKQKKEKIAIPTMTGLMSKDEDEVNSETMKPGNLIIELSICFRTVLHAFAQFCLLLLCCFCMFSCAFVQFCLL